MQCNVGGTDRVMRTALGLGCLAAGMVLPVSWGWRAALFALSGIGLGTAATRYCPVNAAIGLDTCHDGQAV